MPVPISTDLRARVVASWEAGEGTQQEVADRFKVGVASVRRWVARQRRTGSLEPTSPDRSQQERLVDDAGAVVLADLVSAHSDATEEELADMYAEETGKVASRSTINRELKRLGLTRKKRRS